MATAASQTAEGTSGARPSCRALSFPPTSYFVVSAIFHYLGPALAVLLFAHVAALGVMWLRIAGAAVVFAVWRRPWRLAGRLDRSQRSTLLALGVVLAAMNAMFYLAIARLPLATVGAIEFLGTVVLAALGARSRRNIVALAITIAGVASLTVVQVAARPLGIAIAFGNCAGFMLYVVLAHRIAKARHVSPRPFTDAIDFQRCPRRPSHAHTIKPGDRPAIRHPKIARSTLNDLKLYRPRPNLLLALHVI